MVFLDDEKRTKIEQRTGKGIWQGLYQFPLFETSTLAEEKEIYTAIAKEFPKTRIKSIRPYNTEIMVHKLSHQHLKTRFWIVDLKVDLDDGVLWSTLEDYPVPVLIADFIKSFKNHYF